MIKRDAQQALASLVIGTHSPPVVMIEEHSLQKCSPHDR